MTKTTQQKNEHMRASIQPREYPDYIPDIFVVRLEKERYQLFPNNLFKREDNRIINGNDIFYCRGVFILRDNDDTESFIGREPNAANVFWY